jgi:uracil-DNA glycosylase
MSCKMANHDSEQSRLLETLMDMLWTYQGTRVFNPYRDRDPVHDRPNAPAVRQQNLRCYLEAFAGASYLFVGEAPGYAGCRFSGIPFTCEAQIVGPDALPWTHGLALGQSSLGEPHWERSAKIVWDALVERRDCVLWNVFPWHPYGNTPLSNRMPTQEELEQSGEVLQCVLALFPDAAVYAVGRVSERQLGRLGIGAPYIRHPSHGGKAQFFAGIRSLPCRDRQSV